MTHERAQLSIRRTGGLAGLSMVASIDTHELDGDEAQLVSGALDGLDLEKLEKGPSASPGAADTFHYELEVRRGDTAQTISFGEREMPAELAPVVRTLMSRAAPASRPRPS